MIIVATVFYQLARGQNQDQRNSAEIPPVLFEVVQKDLGMGLPDVKRCLESTGVPFEKMIHTKWLVLNRTQEPALLVEGLVPCLAGNDNGTKLLYARFGGDWRKVFDGVGDTLELAPTTTNGWHDIVFWQHDNASRSARHLCRFGGTHYRWVSCNLVRFKDEISQKTFRPPLYGPCTEEFLEMRPN